MPWRDLPERFGPWKSVYSRFANWAKKGRWELIFKGALSWKSMTSVRSSMAPSFAHPQDASGGKGGPAQCPRPFSREVFSTKLHAVVDTKEQTPSTSRSRRGNGTGILIEADELLADAPGKAFIADAGYDSNRFRQLIREQEKTGRDRLEARSDLAKISEVARALRLRFLVECLFHSLNRFRAIATRFEKTARNFLALTQVACAWLWLAPN